MLSKLVERVPEGGVILLDNGVSWIKLSVHLFSNPKIRALMRSKNGHLAVLLWVYLLTLAGQCNDDGRIFIASDVPYTFADLADDFGEDPEKMCEILSQFKRLKMITEDTDGFLTVSGWSKHQSVDRLAEIREYNRLAKQRERERKKNDVNDLSLTSQHRKEKKRKDKKTPPKPPSENVSAYAEFVEGLTEKG